MPAPITTSELIDQVRYQIDEENNTTVSDEDILQALNRGQDNATHLMVNQYPDPLVTFSTTTSVRGQRNYSLPEDIFEDKLQKVEILESGIAWEVKRIRYRDVSYYETQSQAVRPLYYYILGKEFYLLPTPAGGNRDIRYWYIRELDPFVTPQGRITSIDTVNNYVVVNSLGDDLTTESDNLNNYLNIVDAQTGLIKVSMQIQSIDTDQNRVTFKTTPDRSSVFNREISGAIPTTVEVDDFLCVSRGNCVPYLKKPLSNYVVQYAVLEIKRKMGEPVDAEERALKKFEDTVEGAWSGREHQLRVTKRSRNWFSRFRRHFSD
jgi:hypothetical protein